MLLPRSLTRRETLLLMAAWCVAASGAQAAQEIVVAEASVEVAGRALPIRRYLAAGTDRRPIVVLLHGSRGLSNHLPAYDRYARDLAAAGIDAWLFDYAQPDELAAIHSAGSAQRREALYARFGDGWVSLVRTVAAAALKQDSSSGKVGLLGFSLGGFVGVAAASRPLFSALVAFYAGLPAFYHPPIASLPPLLAIHGDADRAVPLSQGAALVARARQLGGAAELAIYAREGHGFDLDLGNRDSASARGRAVAFLRRSLVA
jgi:carboxymethylenebutenolidase